MRRFEMIGIKAAASALIENGYELGEFILDQGHERWKKIKGNETAICGLGYFLEASAITTGLIALTQKNPRTSIFGKIAVASLVANFMLGLGATLISAAGHSVVRIFSGPFDKKFDTYDGRTYSQAYKAQFNCWLRAGAPLAIRNFCVLALLRSKLQGKI
jgi:hypothetical protein